ncbi:MAG: methylated-DNA--[protein]-cysteine S-methyltransferase [Geobacteraceae bacterium]
MKRMQRRTKGRYVSIFETGMGSGAVVASDNGLLEVFIPTLIQSHEELPVELSRLFPGSEGENSLTGEAATLLARYFAAEKVNFSLPVDDHDFTPFQREVYRTVVRIGYGEVKSYGEVALEMGHPQASRGVGTAMASNPLPIVIPCHRVVGGKGSMTGYSAPGGIVLKQWLLRLEGVKLDSCGRVADLIVAK